MTYLCMTCLYGMMQYYTILLIYPVVNKVPKIGSTLMNYNIKMLLHAFVSDKNRILQFSERSNSA